MRKNQTVGVLEIGSYLKAVIAPAVEPLVNRSPMVRWWGTARRFTRFCDHCDRRMSVEGTV